MMQLDWCRARCERLERERNEARNLRDQEVVYYESRCKAAEQGEKDVRAPLEARIVELEAADGHLRAQLQVESGFALVAKERIATLEAALNRLHNAVDDCEGHRGAHSCCEQHDCRCPKARDVSGFKWKDKLTWKCACGREELDAAMEAAGVALAGIVDTNEGGTK